MSPDDPNPLPGAPLAGSASENIHTTKTPPVRPSPEADPPASPGREEGLNTGGSNDSARSNSSSGPEGGQRPVISQSGTQTRPGADGQKPIVQFLQLPTERIALEIHSPPYPKTFWPACGRFLSTLGKDYGALLTGLASVGVTVVIAILAHQINQRQAKSLEAQTTAFQGQSKAAQEEVNVKFLEEFRKHLGELTLPSDEENSTKRTLAAITLAQYGDRALPALKMSLATSDEAIRDGAAVVLAQMLSNNSNKDSRALVFTELLRYFEANGPWVRVGVFKCFVMLYRELSDEEVKEAKSIFRKHVPPEADYSGKVKEQNVLIEAAKFFGNWPSRDSTAFLLAVVKNQSCGDEPREQAINYLAVVATGARDVPPGDYAVMIADLRKLLPESSERLKTNISNVILELQKQSGVS